MRNPAAVTSYDQARTAGLTPTRAARWAAYVAGKHAAGETHITLEEAIADVARARDAADRMLPSRNLTAAAATAGESFGQLADDPDDDPEVTP